MYKNPTYVGMANFEAYFAGTCSSSINLLFVTNWYLQSIYHNYLIQNKSKTFYINIIYMKNKYKEKTLHDQKSQ